MLYALQNGGDLDCGSERKAAFDAFCPDGCRVKVHGKVLEESEEKNK